ncbi:hypothetical protein [Mobilicoccus caccae]|uniref:hypothetical protein n=1 Tax=Mobilicoccus caccae TaxID=1859295 RepID=UPI0024E04AA0|nr:hypothetical protein [Mobilicoccus caccae]
MGVTFVVAVAVWGVAGGVVGAGDRVAVGRGTVGVGVAVVRVVGRDVACGVVARVVARARDVGAVGAAATTEAAGYSCSTPPTGASVVRTGGGLVPGPIGGFHAGGGVRPSR